MGRSKEIKKRQKALHRLHADRSRRLKLLIEKGWIETAIGFPENVVPIDVSKSTKVKLLLPPLYYEDIEFVCRDCSKREVFYAHEQQYFFEVLQASPYVEPVRCYDCRQVERERKEEARRKSENSSRG